MIVSYFRNQIYPIGKIYTFSTCRTKQNSLSRDHTLWRERKQKILIYYGWEKMFSFHLGPFLHLQGNQTALSSKDKFQTAIIVICVCIEAMQTIKTMKNEGGKRIFDRKQTHIFKLCCFLYMYICFFSFKSKVDFKEIEKVFHRKKPAVTIGLHP